MKVFTLIIALVLMFGSLQSSYSQSGSAQYTSSITPVSSRPSPYHPAILEAAARTPDRVVPSMLVAGSEEPEEVLVAGIRAANYIEFGSVGFHPNASIMATSGRNLMISLSIYLQENPGLTIRIHGHCNSNAPRTIIAMGKSGDFFEMSPENELRQATAIELSALRAETARQFLMAQGICPDRIQIVADAGNKMIYPQTSLHAHYNDRIEFQFGQLSME